METPVVIKHNEGNCEVDCMFLDSWFLEKSAKCRLFNEVLRPNITYGSVDSWKQCSECSQACNSKK